MSLERALTKLKYDESVSGYALLTNDGLPFLTFSLPEDTIPTIKNTLDIYADSLRLMNIVTSKGIVVLARVNPEWILAVLFVSDVALGVALQRTKNVVDSLANVDLPPPPKGLTTEPPSAESVVAPPAPVPTEQSIDEIHVTHRCTVLKSDRFDDATRIGSDIYHEMTAAFHNLGIDVLLMVDDKRTVFRIAETLAKGVTHIIEVVKWCVAKGILRVDCPEEKAPGKKEIVEMPFFEGEISKAKKEHRPVLELCDGTRTLQDIAQELNIPYFKALQSIIPYRGKSLKIIMRDVEVK